MISFYDICTDFFKNFEEAAAAAFYRELFPFGELQSREEFKNHKYNAIACEIIPTGKEFRTHRFTVGNDFENMSHLLETENFVIMSPLTYVGKARTSKNARLLYALVFDLDGIKGKTGLENLLLQMNNDILPTPTYIVCSGTGLHLYFFLEEPIPMFPSVTIPLEKMKNYLTRHFWNRYVTKLCEDNQVQYEPIWQAFRIVGGVTKDFKKTGHRVKAWQIGKPVSLEYLNRYVTDENKIPKNAIQYKSRMTLEEAKKKYPDWYNRRIINKNAKKYWTIKPALYNWWLKKITTERNIGHRYYCIMCLAIYAKKCGITFDTLKADAFSLLDNFNAISNEDNQFTEQDIYDGLKAYRDEFCTMPINSITHFSGIVIEKNKRNGRKRSDHIKLMNYVRDEINGNKNWHGRKSVLNVVKKYLENNPTATYKEFCADTGRQKSVFYKYKKQIEENRLADMSHDSCEGSFLLESAIEKDYQNQEK